MKFKETSGRVWLILPGFVEKHKGQTWQFSQVFGEQAAKAGTAGSKKAGTKSGV